jgi:hypothetical protein
MPNNHDSAISFIKGIDEAHHDESWTEDNEELAKAFVAYADLKIKEAKEAFAVELLERIRS